MADAAGAPEQQKRPATSSRRSSATRTEVAGDDLLSEVLAGKNPMPRPTTAPPALDFSDASAGSPDFAAVVAAATAAAKGVSFATAPRPKKAASFRNTRAMSTLSSLDSRLIDVLASGDIVLIRVSWLRARSGSYRLERRQDLEKRKGALLTSEEAVDLIQMGQRAVGVLSHGWLTMANPDPAGERLAIVRRALDELRHVKALFWDFGCLYQRPRTEEQEASFQSALKVMSDLYASAVGTTVLQSREIPPRPVSLTGVVQLRHVGGRHTAGANEQSVWRILTELGYGDVQRVSVRGSDAIVHFGSHNDAVRLATGRTPSGEALTRLCSAASLVYNERPYESRGATIRA
jgi:hypothetical protein